MPRAVAPESDEDYNDWEVDDITDREEGEDEEEEEIPVKKAPVKNKAPPTQAGASKNGKKAAVSLKSAKKPTGAGAVADSESDDDDDEEKKKDEIPEHILNEINSKPLRENLQYIRNHLEPEKVCKGFVRTRVTMIIAELQKLIYQAAERLPKAISTKKSKSQKVQTHPDLARLHLHLMRLWIGALTRTIDKCEMDKNSGMKAAAIIRNLLKVIDDLDQQVALHDSLRGYRREEPDRPPSPEVGCEEEADAADKVPVTKKAPGKSIGPSKRGRLSAGASKTAKAKRTICDDRSGSEEMEMSKSVGKGAKSTVAKRAVNGKVSGTADSDHVGSPELELTTASKKPATTKRAPVAAIANRNSDMKDDDDEDIALPPRKQPTRKVTVATVDGDSDEEMPPPIAPKTKLASALSKPKPNVADGNVSIAKEAPSRTPKRVLGGRTSRVPASVLAGDDRANREQAAEAIKKVAPNSVIGADDFEGEDSEAEMPPPKKSKPMPPHRELKGRVGQRSAPAREPSTESSIADPIEGDSDPEVVMGELNEIMNLLNNDQPSTLKPRSPVKTTEPITAPNVPVKSEPIRSRSASVEIMVSSGPRKAAPAVAASVSREESLELEPPSTTTVEKLCSVTDKPDPQMRRAVKLEDFGSSEEENAGLRTRSGRAKLEELPRGIHVSVKRRRRRRINASPEDSDDDEDNGSGEWNFNH